MRKVIRIGNREFKFKKDALNYYKGVLNAYDFEELLSNEHYTDVFNLLNYNVTPQDSTLHHEIENETSEDYIIDNIRIGRAQYNTKCFELVYSNGESEFISYRLLISQPKHNPITDFYIAARNSVRNDIRSVKQVYFDEFSQNGAVPCQETGIQSTWTELVIDHRQPNTFSVIADRFIELHSIELENLEYKTDEHNFLLFDDNSISEKFIDYHKKKATLRIVRKECNASRAHLGRIGEQKKDLRIRD